MSLSNTEELWRHSSPQTTAIYDFMTKASKKHGVSFSSYHDLWHWSVSEPAKFWEDVWHYTAVKAHQPYETVRSFASICVILYCKEKKKKKKIFFLTVL